MFSPDVVVFLCIGQVQSLKNVFERFCTEREVVLYCDMHGHSRKHNAFLYGCENSGTFADHEKIFPMLLQRLSPAFSLRDCDFRTLKCKESTGRVN